MHKGEHVASDAAKKAKTVVGRAADKVQEGLQAAGDAIKDAGDKLKR